MLDKPPDSIAAQVFALAEYVVVGAYVARLVPGRGGLLTVVYVSLVLGTVVTIDVISTGAPNFFAPSVILTFNPWTEIRRAIALYLGAYLARRSFA